MVVSWGCTIPAGAMSSTEIIAKSAGTESPRLRSPRTAPMATLSLAQKMAVGGFSSFRREATPRSPPLLGLAGLSHQLPPEGQPLFRQQLPVAAVAVFHGALPQVGDAGMSPLQQVLHRHPGRLPAAAQHLVHRRLSGGVQPHRNGGPPPPQPPGRLPGAAPQQYQALGPQTLQLPAVPLHPLGQRQGGQQRAALAEYFFIHRLGQGLEEGVAFGIGDPG